MSTMTDESAAGRSMRTVPWARVMGEGAVIVVSILLALALDAWWASVESDQEAHRELTVVLEELRAARVEVEAMGRWHDRLGHGMRSLADELASSGGSGSVMVDDTVLAGALLFPVTDPPLTVFNAFLESGHLQRLGNAELRRGLASWRAQVDDQRGDELRARSFEDVELAPYLRARFQMAEAQGAATSLWLAGLDSLPDGIGTQVSLEGGEHLGNLVARQVAWYRLTSSQSRAVLRSLDDLIKLVEIELGH